jgi:hypothetical protein
MKIFYKSKTLTPEEKAFAEELKNELLAQEEAKKTQILPVKKQKSPKKEAD